MEEQKKGTTTVGLLCKDGVVLASESRATMGNLIANKNVQKVFPIKDHIGMTTAGGVADAQKLMRILKAQISLYQIRRDSQITVDASVKLLSNILNENRIFPYYVHLLVGGFDEEPRLYSLDALGSVIDETKVATGSGSPVAYGVLEDKFKENKSVEDNIPIALKAIDAAIERDAMSGNNVNLAKITKDGFERLDPEDYK